MKLEQNAHIVVKFGEIEAGECFKRYNDYLMKLDDTYIDTRLNEWNCVNLSSGELSMCSEGDLVEVVHIKGVIE